MKHTSAFCLACFAVCAAYASSVVAATRFLSGGEIVNYQPEPWMRDELQIYCYRGKSKSVLNVFESLELQLDIETDDYTQYNGATPQAVREAYEKHQSLFSLTLFAQKRPQLQISPFENQCFGLYTAQPYVLRLQRTPFDYTRCAMMFAGLFIFTHALRLSNNHLFYYIAGVVLGISASVLVVIYFVAKLLPKKPLVYGTMLGGWSLSLYLFAMLAGNVRLILLTYHDYVLYYICVTGIISFLLCYRFGPPTNPRSKRIIQWVLQAIGALVVVQSTQLLHFSAVLLLVTTVLLYVRISIPRFLKSAYYRRFPPKRQLLTMDEYEEQGIKETERSLRELREFVHSPKCKQFQLLSRLKDPVKFVKFANGGSHLFADKGEDEDLLWQLTDDVNEEVEDVEEEEEEEEFDVARQPAIKRQTHRNARYGKKANYDYGYEFIEDGDEPIDNELEV